MPHNASLNDPEAGLKLHQLGGRAQQWLAWKLKIDAVLDSWVIICVFHNHLLQKEKNVLGPYMVKIVLYGGTVLYGLTP